MLTDSTSSTSPTSPITGQYILTTLTTASKFVLGYLIPLQKHNRLMQKSFTKSEATITSIFMSFKALTNKTVVRIFFFVRVRQCKWLPITASGPAPAAPGPAGHGGIFLPVRRWPLRGLPTPRCAVDSPGGTNTGAKTKRHTAITCKNHQSLPVKRRKLELNVVR